MMSEVILLANNYGFTRDEMNYILVKHGIVGESGAGKRKTKKENIGKEVWRTVGYYNTLSSLLKGFYRNIATDEIADTKEIEDFMTATKRIEDKIDRCTDEIKELLENYDRKTIEEKN